MDNTGYKMKFKVLTAILAGLVSIQMLSVTAFAEKPTSTWNLEGWRVDSTVWIKGNLFTWHEGDNVPIRLRVSTFAKTGQTIAVQHDYMDANGAIGFDGTSGWFIGPRVPDSVPYEDVPVVYTPGPDTFIVDGPHEIITSNGVLLEYRLVPNTTNSFLTDLENLNNGEWAIYWKVHMSKTGTPNQHTGTTVEEGSGFFTGNSLHTHTSVTGSQDVPIGTQYALEKTSVTVTKTWIGPAAPEAIIRLLANGIPTGATLSLTAANGYSGTFTDLPVLDSSNHTIVYTISEDPIPNYSTVITGTAATGFTVTNTNNETVNIPVHKVWVGPAATQAIVRLFADGTPTGTTLTLNAGNSYSGVFSGLDKYSNTDGHLIVYTISEDSISGYSTVITGSAAAGFTITNTNDETVNIPVHKIWIGPAAIQATIRLVADGIPTGDTLVLNLLNNYMGSFDGLDKYSNSDGHLILYTITEDPILNYSAVITGSAATGFTVTNTNNETVDIPVRKIWVGPAAAQAVIRLVADGTPTGATLTLNSSNGYAGSFTGLDKYNNTNGNLIVYTITEDVIPNYSAVITGSAASGFTVTNTNNETIDIPVRKTWIGPSAAKAVIRLVADGTPTGAVLELTSSNGYAGSFTGLDKYNNTNGNLIIYTITEDVIPNYSTVISGSAAAGFTVTNTNDETIDIPVRKVWTGPTAVQAVIRLVADGTPTGATLVLDAGNSYRGSFEDLDKYSNTDGHLILYTITEDPIPNYSTVISGNAGTGFIVTNTNDETVNIPVHKVWIGPAAVQAVIRLVADGIPTGDILYLNLLNNYTGSFTGLDKYSNVDGHLILYTITEDPILNYSAVISGSAVSGFTVTNTNNETVDIPVRKVWIGPAAAQAIVRLVADGTPTGAILTLNASNGYSGSFTGLDKYNNVNGAPIVYTITEDPVTNYSKVITGNPLEGFVVTNTNNETINIPVMKVWIGPAAAQAIVRLVADGIPTGAVLTLNAANGYSGSFNNLDKYNNVNGAPILYTITEDPIVNYSAVIMGNQERGFVVTNTNNETINIPVTKVWVGPAAAQATIRLFADGMPTGDTLILNFLNGYSGSFNNLDKYNNINGAPIAYTISEDPIVNYSTVITGNQGVGFTVTNTNDETVNIPVTKVWIGPAAAQAVIRFVADGIPTGAVLTLNASNGYSGAFTGLDKYSNADGHLILYTITEDSIINYSTVISGNAGTGFIVTNTNNETVNIPVRKVWVGPAAVQAIVRLLADGVPTGAFLALNASNGYSGSFTGLDKYNNINGAPILYTITEDPVTNYSTVITGNPETGFVVTNTNDETINIPVHKTWIGPAVAQVTVRLVADGTPTGLFLTLNASNGFSGAFTGLDKYNNINGAPILYTINEDAVPDYSTQITGSAENGFVVTNTNDETIDIPVQKVWIGPAATQAIVRLVADGTPTGATLVLNALNNYTGSFNDLDKYNNVNGAPILYTITEDYVDGYSSVVRGNASDGFIVTNTNDETINIPVTKAWIGPAAVQATIRLVADGIPTGDVLILNLLNNYSGSFNNLDKYNNINGAPIIYTITEDPIVNYSTVITGNQDRGFTVTNTNDETVNVPVIKVWIGPAAGEVTIRLVADGIPTGAILTLNAANGYSGSFTNLDKYNNINGAPIVYTITEDAVMNYSTVITGNPVEGFIVTNTNDETVDIPVTKTWIGPAAEQAVIRLVADGTPTGAILTLNAANGYSGSFTGLDKYNNVNGDPILYTITEDAIEDYSTVITPYVGGLGFAVTNTNDETIDIPVTKVWIGPAAGDVTVHLVADGTPTGVTLILSSGNQYTGSFTDLDKYNNTDGELIVYTITEDAVANYSTVIAGDAEDGFTITNTNDETVDIPVIKNWSGPEAGEVTIRLVADGTPTGATLLLNTANGYSGSFTNLDKYNNTNGELIVYTITEDAVTDYNTTIEEGEVGFIVTNTIKKGDLRIIKVDQFGVRLPGAVFELATDEDFTDAEEIGTTNESGVILVTGLNVGTYYVREKSAPIGYTKSNDITSVTIVEGQVAEITFVNTKDENFHLNKRDTATEANLLGAVFKFYKDSECTIPYDDMEYTTDEYGDIWLILPDGVYYVREEVAPDGYKLDSTPVEITITGGILQEIILYNIKDEEEPETGTMDYQYLMTGMILLLGGVLLIQAWRKENKDHTES